MKENICRHLPINKYTFFEDFTCSFSNFLVSHRNLFFTVIQTILILHLGNIIFRSILGNIGVVVSVLVNLEHVTVRLVVVVGVVEGGDETVDGGGHDVAGLGAESHVLAVQILLH